MALLALFLDDVEIPMFVFTMQSTIGSDPGRGSRELASEV